jgi:hypothetical protein
MNPEEVFQFLFDRSKPAVMSLAARYSRSCSPGPLTDVEELIQVVWTKLWEWVTKNPVDSQALCTPADDALKFISTFAKCKLHDQLDMARASNRDVRMTKNASGETATGATLLELADHGQLDASLGQMLDDIRDSLPEAPKRILDLLVNTPAYIRESFLESRTKLSEGPCQFVKADGRYGTSTLALHNESGDPVRISWEGPLEAGMLDTDAGRARVSNGGPDVIMDLPAGLLIQLPRADLDSNRESVWGEWIQETVQPSQAVLDERIWADYLGWSQSKVHYARRDLQRAVTAFLEPDPS